MDEQAAQHSSNVIISSAGSRLGALSQHKKRKTAKPPHTPCAHALQPINRPAHSCKGRAVADENSKRRPTKGQPSPTTRRTDAALSRWPMVARFRYTSRAPTAKNSWDDFWMACGHTQPISQRRALWCAAGARGEHSGRGGGMGGEGAGHVSFTLARTRRGHTLGGPQELRRKTHPRHQHHRGPFTNAPAG